MQVKALDATIPVLALALGTLGFLWPSTVLLVIAVVVAAFGVTLGVLAIGSPASFRWRRRRRRY